jgi:hypothetical protein
VQRTSSSSARLLLKMEDDEDLIHGVLLDLTRRPW